MADDFLADETKILRDGEGRDLMVVTRLHASDEERQEDSSAGVEVFWQFDVYLVRFASGGMGPLLLGQSTGYLPVFYNGEPQQSIGIPFNVFVDPRNLSTIQLECSGDVELSKSIPYLQKVSASGFSLKPKRFKAWRLEKQLLKIAFESLELAANRRQVAKMAFEFLEGFVKDLSGDRKRTAERVLGYWHQTFPVGESTIVSLSEMYRRGL